MTITAVRTVDDLVPVRRVLISVFDKTGLGPFVEVLVGLVPDVKILSTGGTYAALTEILGERAGDVLQQVSDYTGQPETQGGLVKTLDFKIYLGLLTETYNPAHQDDLARTGAEPIDMVVVNLYPFGDVVAREGATVEDARGHIDIGGPCMLRAAAKNFLRVVPVVRPEDYQLILQELEKNSGATTLDFRAWMARFTFTVVAEYDEAIAKYLTNPGNFSAAGCYDIRR